MGATKTDLYTDRQNRLSTLLKAVAHPARIAILDYLTKVDACICNDIVNELPLAQPTVSQHLRELKNAGIIKGNIEGNAICYCINEEVWAEIKTYIEGVSEHLHRKNSCC